MMATDRCKDLACVGRHLNGSSLNTTSLKHPEFNVKELLNMERSSVHARLSAVTYEI